MEVERGEGSGRRPQALAALALAIGAVTLARGCAGAPLAGEVLAAAHGALDGVLDAPSAAATRRPSGRRRAAHDR
jgi:hypothetical protein